MECPNCKHSVEYIPGESEICPECGSELKNGDAQESRAQPAQNVFAGVDFAAIFSHSAAAADTEKMLESPQADVINARESFGSLSARAREIADNIEDMEIPLHSTSECPFVEVEYNRNLFFLSGSESVMKLRITPKTSELKHLLIFMENMRSEEQTRRQIPVNEILQMDRTFTLQISYKPQQISGRLSFVFYIGCQTEKGLSYYQFSVEHKVYDPEQAGSTLSQIVINQNFESKQAADINYHDNIGDGLRKIADKSLSVHELIDRLSDLPLDYARQILTETTWRPEDVFVQGNIYPTEKLCISWNGYNIFLLGKDNVKFGRSAEQVDLVIRAGGGKLGPRDYPNSTVSRLHAEVLYCSDTVKFFDHSSYGTYINGRKPDGGGIPIPDKAVIEFGDIHCQMNLQHCEMRSSRNICQSCQANKIKSMTFERCDGEKECYLLVWQCCELGRIFPELADWNVFFRNHAFFIRTPEQDFYYLRPGHEIKSNGQKIQVKYF